MNIRTIEDNFDYQAKDIIQQVVNDYKEDSELTGVNLEDWLWENRSVLGEYFYNQVDSYMGMDELIEEIEF